MTAAGEHRTPAQIMPMTSAKETPKSESPDRPAAATSDTTDATHHAIQDPGVDVGAKVERATDEPTRSAGKGGMSSEPEPVSATPAAPPSSTEADAERPESEPAASGAAPKANNGKGSAIVAELGALDTSTEPEDEPEIESEARPDEGVAGASAGPEPAVASSDPAEAQVDPSPTPDPRWNGSGPAESAPVAAGGGVTSSGASAAASAASVTVASAVSVTADKLTSAGAAARSFGQVVAASLATPPAGVPLLRRERRTPPAAPPKASPVAINPTATATVPDTRPVTPPVDEPVEEPSEEPTGTVDAPPEAPPETPPSAPADPLPSTQTVPDPVTPTLEPVAPQIPPAADSAETTATLPRVPTIGPAPITPARRRPRRARLKVTRLDPWTVMKVAFLLSLAAGIMTMVAVAVLWSVLDSANVFSEVGSTLREVTGGDQGDAFDLESYLSLRRVLTFTGIVAGIEVIVLTALTTLGAFLYNVSARMAGGVEVTLAEDD